MDSAPGEDPHRALIAFNAPLALGTGPAEPPATELDRMPVEPVVPVDGAREPARTGPAGSDGAFTEPAGVFPGSVGVFTETDGAFTETDGDFPSVVVLTVGVFTVTAGALTGTLGTFTGTLGTFTGTAGTFTGTAGTFTGAVGIVTGTAGAFTGTVGIVTVSVAVLTVKDCAAAAAAAVPATAHPPTRVAKRITARVMRWGMSRSPRVFVQAGFSVCTRLAILYASAPMLDADIPRARA